MASGLFHSSKTSNNGGCGSVRGFKSHIADLIFFKVCNSVFDGYFFDATKNIINFALQTASPVALSRVEGFGHGVESMRKMLKKFPLSGNRQYLPSAGNKK